MRDLDDDPFMPELKTVHHARLEKREEQLKALREYWNVTAAPDQAFRIEDAIELVLYDVKRFSEGLMRMVAKADEQKALLDHKGKAVTPADEQRWFAYLDVAKDAAEALGMGAYEFGSGHPSRDDLSGSEGR